MTQTTDNSPSNRFRDGTSPEIDDVDSKKDRAESRGWAANRSQNLSDKLPTKLRGRSYQGINALVSGHASDWSLPSMVPGVVRHRQHDALHIFKRHGVLLETR